MVGVPQYLEAKTSKLKFDIEDYTSKDFDASALVRYCGHG